MSSTSINKQTTNLDPFAFLSGGGEMGERIRSYDWSKTRLGSADKWQQSLKTAVRIMLNSRYPMFVWWGGEFINLYNDAYIPILGKRHPQALGRSAPEIWSEIWPVIGPQAELVLNKGQATWNEDALLLMERNQFLEETYFTFSYSPIPNDQGGIGGVFCACTEETQRVLSQRRLHTLQELAEKASQALTAVSACKLAASALEHYPSDLPFGLIYMLDSVKKEAKLSGSFGLSATSAISPRRVKLNGHAAVWPFNQVAQSGTLVVVDDLSPLGSLSNAVWSEPPRQAAVLPMSKKGTNQVAGFVVVGISPRLDFNADYQAFLELLTDHISTAVANAQAYEEERQRAEALEELDRAKTAFFSNISHEFRTPLTLMLGPIEELLHQDDLISNQGKEKLDVAHRNSLRLLKLVNAMLDFSRIEAGRIQAQYVPTDLAAYTVEIASVFQAAIEKAGLRFIINCPPIPEPVYIDRDMWEKIVLNLLSNAFKFTLEGEIEVSLTTAGEQVELMVRDSGVGIPAEELPHIFERFHRVKESHGRTIEGTGIGLALVKELVKQHGGEVKAKSERNEGSKFVVTIPLGHNHLDATKVVQSPSASEAVNGEVFVQEALRWLPQEGDKATDNGSWLASSPPLLTPEAPIPQVKRDSKERAKIILADDNTDMRQYVSSLLENIYDVTAVSDGQAALAAAQSNPPDLILSDIMMPKMDGARLLKAIRSSSQLKSIPIIFLSARAGEEAKIEGIEAGADDYLIKPFNARELLARIESHLRLGRLRQESEAAVKRSEQRYRQVVQALPMAIYTTDADGRISLFNQAAVDLWGREPKLHQELWCGSWSIYSPDGEPLPLEECPMALTLRQGHSVRKEIIIERPDGERRNIMPYPEPLYDQSGTLVGAVNMLVDITEQIQAKEAVRQSEERYGALFNAIDEGFCIIQLIFDDEGNPVDYIFLEINPKFSQQTGLIDAKGKTARELVANPELDWIEIYGKVAKTGESVRFVNESEEIGRWFDIYAFRFSQSHKNQVAILSSDITERKLAEQNLRKSEQRFREIFENAGVSVWVEDFSAVYHEIETLRTQGIVDFRAYFEQNPEFVRQAGESVKILDVNQATIDLFKAGTKENLLNSLQKIFSPETQNIFIEHLVALADQSGIVRSELQAKTVDGQDIWILAMVNFNLNKVDYSQIVVTVTDITLHKNAEYALRESEQRFKNMADAAPAMLWLTDSQHKCTFLSRGWYDFTGQTESEGLGFGWLNAIHDEDREQVRKVFLSASENSEQFRVDFRLYNNSEGYRWAIAAGRPRFSETGEFLGFIGSVIDMHERMLAEDAVRRLNEQLEQRVILRTNELEVQNRRLRQLANQLSETEQRERRKLAQTLHDGLQQILVAGKMQLKLSLGDQPDVVAQFESLFDEAIQVSRSLSYNLSPPTLHSSNLPEALKWLARWFQSNHRFSVTVQVSPEFPLLAGQLKSFLYSACRELLLNSVKHSGQDNGLVELFVLQNGQVAIAVSDSGKGFHISNLAQEEEDLKGFGLFSVSERVAALGGSMEIETEPGKGARFILTVPFIQEEKPSEGEIFIEETAAASTLPSPYKNGNKAIRILIVDDHNIVRKGLIALLEREEDLEVVGEAHDGVEAVEMAEELAPHVVVMDIDMPRMNGVEATRLIKRKLPNIKVVGLSLLEGQEWIDKMYRVGMSAYLLKGGEADKLLKTIRDLF